MNDKDQFREWLDKAYEAVGEKIRGSDIFAGMVTDSYLREPMCALQLGLAILWDKPIVLIVDKGTKVPPTLTRIAHSIERVDLKNEADLQRAVSTLQSLIESVKPEAHQ